MSVGPRRLGKYELSERLGSGGMAEVWKAFDVQLERYVAIKFLHANLQSDPDFMKRFVREAQVMASLHHPNIVRIHDFETFQPEMGNISAYMVMNYVQGQPLSDYLRNTSRLGKFPPAKEIIYLFSCISSAIDYAHQHGMLHRDIKPANILLDQHSPSQHAMGTPMLTDFGIAKLLGASTNTLSGWWLGTPLYISPEQARGKHGDARSDIYSLAVILYEICTGVQPFKGDNPVAVIMQHIDTFPPAPDLINPKITPPLKNVILRGLAKDPAERYPTATSMAQALADAFNLSTPVLSDLSDATASTIDGLSNWDQTQQNVLARTPQFAPAPTAPIIGLPSTLPPTILTTDSGQSDVSRLNNSASNAPNTFTTPVFATPAPYRTANPEQTPAQIAPPPFTPKKERKSRVIISIALSLLLLLGAGLGSSYYLLHQKTASISTPLIVGQVSFMSSQQLSESGSQGIEDEVKIDLHSIPNPAPGKNYYGWLQGYSQTNLEKIRNCAPLISIVSPIPLGPLNVNHGKIDFLYPGNPQHTNLFGIINGVLITQESIQAKLTAPSTDKHDWKYYAAFPQTPTPNSHPPLSALDHLRCILSQNADVNLPVGLDIQFFRNTKSVWEWAREAENSTDASTIHTLAVRILDYLDGSDRAQQDVPGTPLLVDKTAASVPLLDPNSGTTPNSFQHRLNTHLNAIRWSNDPNLTSDMLKLIDQADGSFENVSTWLEQVRQDAKQLLISPLSLSIRKDMETAANYAYNGQINKATNKQLLGVQQIHNNILQLATFNMKLFSQ